MFIRKNSKLVVTLIMMFSMFCVNAAQNSASGKIKLRKASGDSDKKNIVTKKLSAGKLNGKCSMYVGEYMGQTAIWAGIYLENKSKNELYYVYNIAFFDKKGKLVCCKQDTCSFSALKPGESSNVNCWVVIPESEISKIASFKVILYKSKTKIGI